MKHFGRNIFLPIGIALACIGTSSVYADVSYTLITDYSKTGLKGISGTAEITTYSKAGKKREEMMINIVAPNVPTKPSTSVTITLCDKHEVITLDETRKVYVVRPLLSNYSTNLGVNFGAQKQPQGGEGKLDSTIKVEALGTEKIGDFNAKHVMLTIQMQQSGCVGSRNYTTKLEMWTAPIKVFVCPEMMKPTITTTNRNGCKITVENHGDLAALAEVGGNMIVRQKMVQGNNTFTFDLKNYSEKSLDDSLFEIPAGYKEVSETEFSNMPLRTR